MATIYDYQNNNEITSGLQGCSVCDEAIQAARRIAEDRGEPVELHDDDGEWLVHPDGDCERLRATLIANADTSYHDAEEMYGSYGWHLSTQRAGDVELQVVNFYWLDETDDQSVLADHRDDMPGMTDDERLELLAMARSVRADMEGIESLLEEAVGAYERGDVEAVIEALDAASVAETLHGDDPATSDLRSRLVQED